ncbi:MAG: nucleotide pyrophosphohydrolase [Alicyclobacillus sp.]|nr:nucleotide pyrophosphohydrolase [Alicyclobacillus sp.]
MACHKGLCLPCLCLSAGLHYSKVKGQSLLRKESPVVALSLQQLQAEVDAYIRQFREGYFSPMTLIVRLTEELGELAREVNHRYGEKPKKPDEAEGSVALELGDLLFVIACLANRLNIDLEQAFHDVMCKFQTRDANRWTRLDTPS